MAFKGFVFRVPKLHVEGIALFPFVLVKKKPSSRLLNHEKIHLQQQLELGILFFYLWYLIEYLVRYIQFGNHFAAYYHISFEKEAFLNEANPKYLSGRKLFAFFRYL